MNYALFRNAVLAFAEGNGDWDVHTDWEENAGDYPDEPAEDFIELEQEKGAFYEFMTISMNRLFYSYREDGWDAVCRELDRYMLKESKGTGRKRGIDYEARLDEEGVALYRQLRELRADIAAKRRVPPYIIFMNRALFEMSVKRPQTMEELCEIYGVGRKNSADYGEEFLNRIRGFDKWPKITEEHSAVSEATG